MVAYPSKSFAVFKKMERTLDLCVLLENKVVPSAKGVPKACVQCLMT